MCARETIERGTVAAGVAAAATLAEHRARLKRLAVDGGDLAYVDAGPSDGETILLLHGVPTSSWLYRRVIPLLAVGGCRVIAPDLLGWGASDKPVSLEGYTVDRQAGRIATLLEALGIGAATFVVHDLGGPWTWQLARSRGDYIKRLVVLNTTAYRDGLNPPGQIKLLGGPLGPAMLALMRSRLAGRKLIGDFIRRFVGHPERISADAVEGYWRPLQEGTQAFLQMARSFDDFYASLAGWAAVLERLHVPAMVVWGAQDPVLDGQKLPGQFARSLRIPPDRIHIFPDAGHYIQEDRPEELARLVLEFVRDDG